MPRFDPEGEGYDEETAMQLIKKWPLKMLKPDRPGKFEGETLGPEDAFEAWVWHGKEKNWFKHGGSLDPRTGMLLKGMKHSSIGLTIGEEKRRGSFLKKREDGRYYAAPYSEKIFDYIRNAR